MNPMISNILLMLIVNKFSGKLDFEDESVLNTVRACYVASNIIIVLAYLYCRQVITKKNDMTTIKYQKPTAPFSQETGETITTTNVAYDLEQVSSGLKGVGQGILMMAFMHLYMKYSQPLVLQSIMPLKALFENKVIQIHLLGRSGPDFVRPFATASLFGDLMGQGASEATQKIKAE